MKIPSKIKFLPVYAFSILPIPVLLGLADVAFFLIFYVIKYRHGVVEANLKNSFPEKSLAEIKQIKKQFYRHFCDVMVLSAKSLTISEKEVRKRLRLKNLDLIQKYYDEKRSILLYTGHQGNWEWLLLLPVFLPHQCSSFYQPLRNAYFEELMLLIRSRFGLTCLPSQKGYRALAGYKRDGILNLNYVIGDQSPHRSRPRHWVKFLHQDTAFLIGANRIAKKLGQVVVFAHFKQVKRAYYELEFQLVEENPASAGEGEIIEKYAGLLEKAIQEDPALWLWTHRRWKLKREE